MHGSEMGGFCVGFWLLGLVGIGMQINGKQVDSKKMMLV